MRIKLVWKDGGVIVRLGAIDYAIFPNTDLSEIDHTAVRQWAEETSCDGDYESSHYQPCELSKSDFPAKHYTVLSIDACAEGYGSWTWNNWHTVGHLTTLPDTTRKLLNLLRREGYLTSTSIGTVAVEDDQLNYVVVDKATREPLLAVEYGGYQ